MANESAASKYDLVLTRVFAAPRELMWKAWTEPAQLARWWGPKGFTNPVCEADARAGGAIRIHMRGPDGTIYPMTGRFVELVEPERIVFASAALDAEGKPMFEVHTTVTLVERSGKTELTLQARVTSMTDVAPQFLKGMEQGWSQSLDRLANFVAGEKIQ
jgi:uncharacterized protein YndB with AHSA1/START domain